jgi:hypothetical protein
VELLVRDILVSGRITRSGVPAAGFLVTMRPAGSRNAALYPIPATAAPGSWAPRGEGVTGPDGSYQLVVDDPGRFGVDVRTKDGSVGLPHRFVDVPDGDTHVLDLDYPGTAVSGVVLDEETEQPITRASASASRRMGAGRTARVYERTTSGAALAGPDGRFRLELDPGDYLVSVGAEGYVPKGIDVTVGGAGASDLRVLLQRSAVLAGRVTDARGRRAIRPLVWAVTVRPTPPGVSVGPSGQATTRPDGSFEVSDLAPGAYHLLAASGDGGFAVRAAVATGARDVTLTLQPGGRVVLNVRSPDGEPVAGARATVSIVIENTRTSVSGLAGGPGESGAEGTLELTLPAGPAEIRVGQGSLRGRASVTVKAGETVTADVPLSPAPARRSVPAPARTP